MLTPDGPKVIEYNCRFGDPETQVVLPLLEGDLLRIMQACTNGTLENEEVKFSDGAAACVILASGGYPVAYEKGKPITGLVDGQLPGEENVTVYHSGTAITEDGTLVTAGGRVLGVTATGPRLTNALSHAYEAAEKISFEKLHKRSDIGLRAEGTGREAVRKKNPLSRLAAAAPPKGELYAGKWASRCFPSNAVLSASRKSSPFRGSWHGVSVTERSVQRIQRGNLPNGLSYLCGKKARL